VLFLVPEVDATTVRLIFLQAELGDTAVHGAWTVQSREKRFGDAARVVLFEDRDVEALLEKGNELGPLHVVRYDAELDDGVKPFVHPHAEKQISVLELVDHFALRKGADVGRVHERLVRRGDQSPHVCNLVEFELRDSFLGQIEIGYPALEKQQKRDVVRGFRRVLHEHAAGKREGKRGREGNGRGHAGNLGEL